MVKYIKTSALLAVLILGTTGCSTKDVSNDLLSKKESEIQRLTQELESAKKGQQESEAKLQRIANKPVAAVTPPVTEVTKTSVESNDVNAISNSLVPPNAKPGECYAKVLVPATYKQEKVQQLVEEAKTKIKVIPATYKVVEKKVTIREPRTKIITIPATYKSVTEKVMVEPEKTKLVVVPATYKTVKEKVLVKAAHTEWKKGRGEIEKVNNGTGEIMCLVEVPAVYKTVTKKVLVKDASTKEVKIPAVYKTVTKKAVATPETTKKVTIPAVYKNVKKRVLATPATTKEVKIPAVYKTVKTRVLVTPATTKEETIPGICKMVKTRVVDVPAKEIKTTVPAVYSTYVKKVQVSEPYLRWQPVLCQTNTQANIISKLQKKLKAKKYKISRVNGVYNAETKAAVQAYQKDNKLSQGALTLKTLQSLGL
ncbi:MAG: hypothetical protein DSZ03_01400 [Sulfurimonas sp.]|nr:MAG: hypothetical protein DSZ03_01400 [Sulfurimonas sp.]